MAVVHLTRCDPCVMPKESDGFDTRGQAVKATFVQHWRSARFVAPPPLGLEQRRGALASARRDMPGATGPRTATDPAPPPTRRGPRPGRHSTTPRDAWVKLGASLQL